MPMTMTPPVNTKWLRDLRSLLLLGVMIDNEMVG
jgi:hypothetical protein